MSLAWSYLMLFTIIFCEVVTLISRILVNPQEFDLALHFSKGLGSSPFSLLLIPIVILSLKWAKSYLFLSIFCLVVYIFEAYLLIHAIQSVDMTGYIGSVPLYYKGDITVQGWISILLSPFLVASLCAFLIFLKQKISKK